MTKEQSHALVSPVILSEKNKYADIQGLLMCVSRFKNRIRYVRVRFELEVAFCRAHIRGHLSQLLGIHSSPLSI